MLAPIKDLGKDNFASEPTLSWWRTRKAWAAFLMLFGLSALTIFCYRSILFNFFLSDDFCQLEWSERAMNQPSLILRNFYTTWLDTASTKFYRPLVPITILAENILWHGNGFGLHLTNVLTHLACAFVIFLITLRITQQLNAVPQMRMWPYLSFGIFALYPIHPEAVSWIIGRCDLLVTLFYLTSFYFYMKWRTTHGATSLVLSSLAMVIALMSKEMAITLPLLFVCWELLLHRSQSTQGNELWTKCKEAARATMPFWLILTGYFIVRRLALGTFLGGYDDKLLPVCSWEFVVLGAQYALKMFFYPINCLVVKTSNFVFKLWTCLLSLAFLGIIKTCLFRPRQTGLVAFLFLFILVSALPLYKLLYIAPDLESSRFAYLPSVALSCLLALGFCELKLPSRSGMQPASKILSASLSALFIGLCAAFLFLNNEPWALAGAESVKIQEGFKVLFKQESGRNKFLFGGLPDQIKGAYVCRNAFSGLTRRPDLSLGGLEERQITFPVGIITGSDLSQLRKQEIYWWNSARGKFMPLTIYYSPDKKCW